MTSEIRVNKIENRSGLGTVTFADTGVDLAGIVTATTFSGSGASLTGLPAAQLSGTLPAISGANLTNLAAANLTGTIADARFPATLPAVSAASLTQIPAANIVGLATAGFGNASGAFSQGITMADQWRVTAAQTTNDATLIYNWERNDTQSTLIGGGMSTNAGHWTFPTTGLYLIMFGLDAYNDAYNRYIGGNIDHSTDSGSSYDAITEAYNSTSADTSAYASVQMHAFLDVTNASTQRVRFRIVSELNVVFNGSSTANRLYATFLRLGDT